MSIKKLEKPVTAIFHSLRASLFGFTRRSVFFLLAKCVSITRNDTAEVQRRGKTRAVNAHIAWEDEEPVAEHIEDAARQHTKRRKCGRAVVAQKCREHLIEEEQREYNFNGDHVPLREGEQRLIRAEKHQKRTLEEDGSRPTRAPPE